MFQRDLHIADYLNVYTCNPQGDMCTICSRNDTQLGKIRGNMERKMESPALKGLITTSRCVRVSLKDEVILLTSFPIVDERMSYKS